MSGPVLFKNHTELLEAMRIVQDHLRDEYIVEECREHLTEGCISCDAIKLWDGIEVFAAEVEDDDLRSARNATAKLPIDARRKSP